MREIKFVKKLFLAILMVLLLPFSIAHAKEVPDHDSNYYIDELNVLSEETKTEINNQELPDCAQIFVLTINDLDEDPFDFAMKAFKKYQIGDKDKDNGLLIMLARTETGKHHIRVITGYGLEEKLPDGKVGRIIDNYMMPQFQNDDLDKGINHGFKVFTNEIKAPLKREKIVEPTDNKQAHLNYQANIQKTQEEKVQEIVENLCLKILAVLLFFIAPITLIGNLLLSIREERKINKMTYDDFLKRAKRYDSSSYYERFQELVKDKDLETIKRDMAKATTFRDLFKDEYEERKINLYEKQALKELISKATQIEYEDYPIYEKVVRKKLKEINTESIKYYLSNTTIYNPLYEILKDEYVIRKRNELSDLSFDDLINKRYNRNDKYLYKEEIDEIAKQTVKSKIRGVSDNTLDNVIRYTQFKQLGLLERDRRERSRHSNDSNSSYSSGSSSFGGFSSGSSSSSFGGFSGGGGSSGGGGAGRSF